MRVIEEAQFERDLREIVILGNARERRTQAKTPHVHAQRQPEFAMEDPRSRRHAQRGGACDFNEFKRLCECGIDVRLHQAAVRQPRERHRRVFACVLKRANELRKPLRAMFAGRREGQIKLLEKRR